MSEAPFCACGCGGRVGRYKASDRKKGIVKGEWAQFIPHHNRRQKTPGWEVDEATGCWLWTGQLTAAGYGAVYVPGRRYQPAHRWVYETRVGPVPEGLELDHVCHSRDPECRGGVTCPHRRCVNPDHLEPVTNAENVRRGVRATATYCPSGHPYSGDNLYIAPDGRRKCRACRRLSNHGPRSKALIRPIRSLAWELRAHWASGRRVSLRVSGDEDRLEGHVSSVSATDAYAIVAGWHVPLDRILSVHVPSRLGDSTFVDGGSERWAGRVPRALRRLPGQLDLEDRADPGATVPPCS